MAIKTHIILFPKCIGLFHLHPPTEEQCWEFDPLDIISYPSLLLYAIKCGKNPPVDHLKTKKYPETP
jgi:hypothetical protein